MSPYQLNKLTSKATAASTMVHNALEQAQIEGEPWAGIWQNLEDAAAELLSAAEWVKMGAKNA